MAKKKSPIEKEKVLTAPLSSLKSFMGKQPDTPKKNARPGLFDKLKGRKK